MARGVLRAVAAGVGAGLLGAAALGRLASTFLYGVEPLDPVIFAATAAALGMVAGTAAVLPAWRAAGMDPADILKRE
jgi:ABC-type antimicrobial peptide transport system permease subunit